MERAVIFVVRRAGDNYLAALYRDGDFGIEGVFKCALGALNRNLASVNLNIYTGRNCDRFLSYS